MLSGKPWEIAVHEAGHAVVSHLLGLDVERTALTPEGGVTALAENPVRDRDTALRAATTLWAGKVAVELVCGRSVARRLDSETDKGAQSDDGQIIALALKYAEDDPLEFSASARRKALLLLSRNYNALVEGAKRVCWGDRMDAAFPPLVYLSPEVRR